MPKGVYQKSKEHLAKMTIRLKAMSGKNHPCWKGNKVSYLGLHHWLAKYYGKASKCQNTNCTKISKTYHWALVKGRKYLRKRENFIELCSSCHKIYDFKEETRKKMSMTRQKMNIKLPSNKGRKYPQGYKKRKPIIINIKKT